MRMILAVGVLSRVQPWQLKCRACRVVAGPCAVVHDMRVSTDSPWGAVVWVLYFWHHSVSGGGAAACPIQLGGGDGRTWTRKVPYISFRTPFYLMSLLVNSDFAFKYPAPLPLLPQ